MEELLQGQQIVVTFDEQIVFDQLQPAVILEFKVRNPGKEASLEETVQTALEQIEIKQYDTELLARGIEKERIRHYGFAFEGKQVLIG